MPFKTIKYIFIFAFLLLSFCNATTKKQKIKKLLVIHSYHQGLQWTDSITQGIQDIIRPQNDEIDVFYEYLDSKRYLDSAFVEQQRIFTRKYEKHHDFYAIICVDDNAFDFLLQNRQRLFRGIPIIFCGVNQPLKPQVFQDSLITGIREIPAIRETLDLMLRLRPNSDAFYIINDAYSLTAKINRKITDSIAKGFPKKIIYLDSLSLEELNEKVAKIPKKDAILLLTFNQDKHQEFVSFKDENHLIKSRAKAPVFTVWDFFLGQNVVGGKIIQGKKQGQLVAEMALKVLNGLTVDSLPIVLDSKSAYIFDNRELHKFNFLERELPKQSTIINKYKTSYNLSNTELLWLTITFLSLLWLVSVLFRQIRKKKEAEKALLEQQKSLKMTLSQHHLISDIVTFLNSTNRLSFVIDDVLNAITKTRHVDKVFLLSLDNKDAINEAIGLRYAAYGKRVVKKKKEDWESVLQRLVRVVATKERLVRNNLSSCMESERVFFVEEDMLAVVLLPVEVQEKVNAILGFAFSHSHEWTDSEINLFSTLAQVLANAWERNFQMNQYLIMEKQHGDAVSLMERSSRLASIGVLTAGITHEINQPLNAIKINTNMLLRKENEKTPLAKKLKAIDKGINIIDQIILQMKNYWICPVEDGSAQMCVDLHEAVRNSCQLASRNLKKANIKLYTELDEGSLEIKGSKIQVEQIIINLLMNAIQALEKSEREDRQIWIKVLKKWHSLQLIVEDNGSGIDESIGEKLFDPFFSTKEEGSGLGLAIVKTFVDKMQGHIRYENRQEGGVCFVLDFKTVDRENDKKE